MRELAIRNVVGDTMTDAYAGGWIEEKIAQRHQTVRLRLMRELHARHKVQRAKRRDYARLALAAALCCLGIATVELGRLAYHLWPSAEPPAVSVYYSAGAK